MEYINYSFQLKNIENEEVAYQKTSIALNNAKCEFNKALIQYKKLHDIISPSSGVQNQEVLENAFKNSNHYRLVLVNAEDSFQNASEKLAKKNDNNKKAISDLQSQFDKIQI